MNFIFEVDKKEIESLDAQTFVDIMNHLLRAEGDSLGIPQDKIQTDLNISAPDEGIDARIEAPPDIPEGWIPEGLSVWQFKALSRIDSRVPAREFNKAGVQSARSRVELIVSLLQKDMEQEYKNTVTN